MQLSVTFRHMDTSDALKDYAREKVERINKYFPDPIKAHVVLACDRGYNHIADVVITLRNGILIKGEEVTEDMYSSIDLVMAKIERQVRRYKEKIRNHRPQSSSAPNLELAALAREASNGAQAEGPVAPKVEAPVKIIKKPKFFARPLSVEEAVMHMNLLGKSFLMFANATSHEVNVVYKREDGTYGLIEPSQQAAAAAQ